MPADQRAQATGRAPARVPARRASRSRPPIPRNSWLDRHWAADLAVAHSSLHAWRYAAVRRARFRRHELGALAASRAPLTVGPQRKRDDRSAGQQEFDRYVRTQRTNPELGARDSTAKGAGPIPPSAVIDSVARNERRLREEGQRGCRVGSVERIGESKWYIHLLLSFLAQALIA